MGGREDILSPLDIFVKTSPINEAVVNGNGNREFYRETTRSKLKIPFDHRG